MKKLLIFLILGINGLQAQDYRAVNPAQTPFFKIIATPIAPILQQGLNSATWSNVKVAAWDSVSSQGSDTIYYGFRTWRDTTTVLTGGIDCADGAGPSWIGDVYITFASVNYFYNYNGDTMVLNGAASVSDTWIFYSFADGRTIRASVDSLIWQMVAGISDTVKYISLTELDSSGLPVASSSISGLQILLSKNNGLFQTICYREFPEGIILLERIPDPTIGFPTSDFNVNDEFEYVESCIAMPGITLPPSYIYDRIVAKWFSTGLDTAYCVRFRRTLDLQFNPSPVPHFDSTLYSMQDTFSYPVTTYGPLQSPWPEENVPLPLQGTFGNYTLDQDSLKYNNRPVFTQTDQSGLIIYSAPDSCYVLNHFEAAGNTTSSAPGLGNTSWTINNWYTTGIYCETHMTWFHKGSETWGSYINIPTGIHEVEDPVSGIFPNPVLETCRIWFSHSLHAFIQVTDLAGKTILETESDGSSVVLDMSDKPKGMYFVRVQTQAGTFFNKILKQ